MRNMNDILRQAQVMQNKLSKLQNELNERTYEASSGGGMVKAVVSGKQELRGLTIDPKALRAATWRCCRTSSWPPSMKPAASPARRWTAR